MKYLMALSVSCLALQFFSSAVAQDLASVSPFRIDIQTSDGDNYQYAYASFFGGSEVGFSLTSVSDGTAYYLGVNTSTQFAAKIEGLNLGIPVFVPRLSDGSFAMSGLGNSSQSFAALYFGQMDGLRPVFSTASAYALEPGKELIDFEYMLSAGSDLEAEGFAVAQNTAGEQAVSLFIWNAREDQVTASTEIDVPSLVFNHSGNNSSFFSIAITDDSFQFALSGYRFTSELSDKTFVADFDRDLTLTASFLVEPAVDSIVTWDFNVWSSGGINFTDQFIATGSNHNRDTFQWDGGYVSLINNSGSVQWTRRYTHSGGSFAFVFPVGKWNREMYLRAMPSLISGGWYIIVVDPDTGAVLRAYDSAPDTTDLNLRLSHSIANSGRFMFFSSGSEEDNLLYATSDQSLENGLLHWLDLDQPLDKELYDYIGWYNHENPALSQAWISYYDTRTFTQQLWFAVEDSCDIFKSTPFDFVAVSVSSEIVPGPMVTPVSVNVSSPTVSLLVKSLALPTVTEEPSSRISECFASVAIPQPSTWYSDAAQIQPAGWLSYDWFKGFKPDGANWIYHGHHGWLYVLADDINRMFLWDVALGRWMFTNATTYPWMYAYGDGGGWVFFFEDGRPSSRFFKRGDSGQVVSEGDLRAN